MASAWSQQELETLRSRLEGSGRINQVEAEDSSVSMDASIDGACAQVEREAQAGGAAQVISLQALLDAAEKAGAAQLRLVLGRVGRLFARATAPAKRAIREAVAGFFDRTARALLATDPERCERFVLTVHDALRATSVLAGHPVGRLIATLGASPEKVEATTAADRLVEKLLARAGAAEMLVASKLAAFSRDDRIGSFIARFEDRVLGANLTVLDRFETAVEIPERMLDFDRRFRLAAEIFPDLALAGTDGESLLGSGKFGWVLGVDRGAKIREASELAELIEQEYYFAEVAEPAAPMPADVGIAPLTGVERPIVSGFGRPGTLEAEPLSGFSAERRYAAHGTLREGGVARAAARSSRAPLARAAAWALRARDAQALVAALGGRVSRPQAESIVSSEAPVRALRDALAVAPLARRAAAPARGLDHGALGFQSMAASDAREAAAGALARLAFGGMAPAGAVGYVAAPSTSFVGGERRRTIGGAERGAESRLAVGAAARRAMELARGDRGPAARAVPAWAIASDSFGVPRYRGAEPLPAAAFRSLEGFDLAGSIVYSGRPAAAAGPSGAGAAGRAAGKAYAYTSDDFGIVRIGRPAPEAARVMGTVARAYAPGRLEAPVPAAREAKIGEPYAAPARAAREAKIGEPYAAPPGARRRTVAAWEPAAGALRAADMEALEGVLAGPVSRWAAAYEPAPAPAARRAAAFEGPRAAGPARGRRALGWAPQGARAWRPSRVTLGTSPAVLAARGPAERHAYEPARASILDKYYAPFESENLALGRAGEFRLAAFTPPGRARSERAVSSHGEPASFARFQQAAPAGEIVPGRLRLPLMAEAAAPLGSRRAWSVSEPRGARRGAREEALEATDLRDVLARWPVAWDESGYAPASRMGRLPLDIERHAGIADDRYARIGREIDAIRRNYSGQKLWRAVELDMSFAPGGVRAPALAAQAASPTAGPAPLAVRRAAPRIRGVYAEPWQPEAPRSDILGLSRHGGIEASHAPAALVARYEIGGEDAALAPIVRGLRSRAEPRALRAARLGTPWTPRSESGRGLLLESPAAEPRAPRPVGLEGGAAGRPLHRFADVLHAATAAPRLSRRAAEFYGEKGAARPGFEDRFSLDGWTTPQARAWVSGEGGYEPRRIERGTDALTASEVVRPRRTEGASVSPAAIPVDLTSQLSGRSDEVGVSARRSRERLLASVARNLAAPSADVYWDGSPEGAASRRRFAAYAGAEPVLPGASRRADADAPEARRAGAREAYIPAERPIGRAAARAEAAAEAREIGRPGTREGLAAAPASRGGWPSEMTTAQIEARAAEPALDGARPARIGARAGEGLEGARPARTRDGAELSGPAPAPRRRAELVSSGPAGRRRLLGLLEESAGEEPVLVGEAGEGPETIYFKRSQAAPLAAPADTRLGARIRQDRGRPLSRPVLAFMERFFQQNLSKVRVHEGSSAQVLNQELGSEAFAVGDDVFLGRAAVGDDARRLGLLGHEVSHVVGRKKGPAADAYAQRQLVEGLLRQSERRARDIERQIVAMARSQQAAARKTPKLDMALTGVGQYAQPAAPPTGKVDEQLPVQKKGSKFADTALQMIEASGERLLSPLAAMFPRPPKRDLTPLVYQVWNKIKRELAIERSRRAGGF